MTYGANMEWKQKQTTNALMESPLNALLFNLYAEARTHIKASSIQISCNHSKDSRKCRLVSMTYMYFECLHHNTGFNTRYQTKMAMVKVYSIQLLHFQSRVKHIYNEVQHLSNDTVYVCTELAQPCRNVCVPSCVQAHDCC